MKLTVETKNGPVKGFEQGGVRVFKGIPYAEGYTEQGRFRAARPCGKHIEPLCADHFPPAAFQISKDARGRFITRDGTVFKGYLFDEKQL